MPLRPLIADKNASVRAAIRAVDSKVRPDFRRAIVCAVLAFTLDGAAPYFGGVHAATLDRRLAAYGTAAGFVVFGLAATRSAANELTRVSLSRAGAAAATPLRVGCLLIGYLIVALTAMELFALPIGNLLVGGAVNTNTLRRHMRRLRRHSDLGSLGLTRPSGESFQPSRIA
jgi:hypothetical protein